MEQDVPIFGLHALRTRHRWSSQYAGRVSHMNLEMAYSSMVSLLLCGRAPKRRIRRAEVQLLVGTQISFCLKLVTRRKNNSFRFIPDSKFIICLILFHCIPFSFLSISFFFFFCILLIFINSKLHTFLINKHNSHKQTDTVHHISTYTTHSSSWAYRSPVLISLFFFYRDCQTIAGLPGPIHEGLSILKKVKIFPAQFNLSFY